MVEDQQLLFHHQHQQQQRLTQGHSRYGMRGSGPGEIVEVQGGHIVRSTGRKDRHSKVCTAKGPRDRRVRLSAHTAIQFYDVQDRLGYDRPSKAVDWLIKNAKAAIDELAERPPWHPTATTTTSTSAPSHPPPQPSDQPDAPEPPANPNGDSGKKPMRLAEHAYAFGTASGSGGDGTGSSFLPPSLASDAIADTIKSFFPMAATANTAPSSRSPIGYRNYPPDLLSRTSSQAQDLRLSLQSFQDSSIFHQPTHHHHHHTHSAATHQALLSASAGLPFDAVSASWPEHNPRLIPWNVAEAASGSAGSGYVFNVPPPPQAVPLHPVLGQTQIFSQQRGPLQSSHSPSVRAWADPVAAAEHAMHPALHPSPAPPVGFVPGGAGGFGGFHIPARIQGEEEHDGGSSKPSSASSASHH